MAAVALGVAFLLSLQREDDSVSAVREPAGPLCQHLPAGTDPGGPALLTAEPADVALRWIPVLTIFEAGVRASGLDADLRVTDEVTILAPTDDAFTATFTQDTLDELFIFRQDELRALLEAHMIDGALERSELFDAGSMTTLAGDTLTVAAVGTMVRFNDKAETVCADYQAANAMIHVIDGVLGELPAPAYILNSS